MTPLEREQVASLRVSMIAVLFVGVVLVAGMLAVGTGGALPIVTATSVALTVAASARLSDRWLLRLRGPIQIGSNVGAGIVVATGPPELAVAMSMVFGLVAVVLPFTTPWPEVLAFHGVAMAAATTALGAQGVGLTTILLVMAAYALIAVLSQRSALDLGDVLGEQERERVAERAAIELTDAVLDPRTGDRAVDPARVVHSLRALGFTQVGVRHEGDPDGVVGDLAPDEIRTVLAHSGGPRGTVIQIPHGDRQAVVLPLQRFGVPVVSIVGIADDEPPPERLELLEEFAAFGNRWLEMAARVVDEERAVRLLADADAHRNDVVASVSHELRTPLTVVRGLAETLLARDVPASSEQGRGLVERLAANARRLEDVVDTVLDLSRLSRDELQADVTEVAVGALVRTTVERLSPLSDGHELFVEAPDDLMVRADPVLLEHVLENLVANAIKHTPDGTRIWVRVRPEERHATVEVVDDGPGIPPEELSRVTERFFRGQEPTARQTSGLGLGLSLVDRILEAHGTTLEVTSRLGRGARFAFRLPVA